MNAETLLDIFVPPDGMVGHSAVLVAMTGAEDFLEDALQRFTGLRPRLRAELGNVLVYLMLDGHASSSRKEVFPPGRIPGLHEFQPRSVNPGSLLHAKVALLAFAPNRTGAPVHLRLAVLTANYTYTSARQQLELVWVVDAPLDGTARPLDRADVAAAGALVDTLLTGRFYRDEQGLVPQERRLTSRLDALLAAASALATNREPRFIHSLERPLYDQIRERFRIALKDNPRNLLLCGSGFYEEPSHNARKPAILGKLEDMGVFTANVRKVALVEPAEAGAVATWAKEGEIDRWEIVRSFDSLDHNRRLHAKFVYAGYLRQRQLSNGWLYLGSGNLSRRGILSHGGMDNGNVETGVVFAVDERLDSEATKRRLFWFNESEAVSDEDWAVWQVGDAPDEQPILEAPPILSAIIETTPALHLRLLWREDAAGARASISWTGRDWFDLQRDEEVPLKDDENPTALHVRDADRKWIVPVMDAAGRIGWKLPRFDTYADALAALLDFPIRPTEATDDDDRDDADNGGAKGQGAAEAIEQEKNYALHAAAEVVEKVAALQAALPESMLDDWLDHLDRMFRASFPEALIATWREDGINVFEHLKGRELRPSHLSDDHAQAAKKDFAILDGAARAWGLVRWFNWKTVAESLVRIANDAEVRLDEGQRASVKWMAQRLPESGLILADEVGTGKTRIACAVVHAVLEAGGRAAVVVPHGLMHQWQHEANVLGMYRGMEFTSLRNFIGTAEPSDCETIAPAPDKSEWLLVSHGFRSPQVRGGNNPAEWRVALPSYVRAAMTAGHIRNDGRTRAGRLLANHHEKTWKIAKAINAQVRGQPSRKVLCARLDRLPWFNRGGNNTELINALQCEEGRQLVEHLLGLWLGEFDLLVIDEAHKSRGGTDVDDTAVGTESGSVLSRLLNKLLKDSESGRRLCLTATPMELDLKQWLHLLGRERARSSLDEERGRGVVKKLHDAASDAAVAPDEGRRLDELCHAARDFTKALTPYVTRRRRDEDPLITSFRGRAALPEGLPHPHRRLQRVQIGWTETGSQSSPWLDVLFAAECMSQSARGLTLKDTADWPRAVRDAYTKLSAGHVSIDLSETSEPLRVPEPGVVDDHTRGKIARTSYWYRRLDDCRRRVLEGFPRVNGAEFNPDAEHPRILAAVKEIESWTLKREKVLVFGVFLQPLRLLRDVLNVRHALRAADARRPIAHSVHTDAALLGIALFQLDRLRAEGALSGRLAKGNGTDMRRALAYSHKVYERLRNKVRRRAKKPVVTWGTDVSLLGGMQADRELNGALEDHLVSFVLDDFLATTSESDEVTESRFEELTAEFVKERLRPLLGEVGNENFDEEQALLRHKTLRTLTEDDDGRQSFYARLLQGATRWETRRYLQAAFNRPGASPWVLIAQSQVGREGLNLQEACRVVVQFHAEWNPAVLEQQIGRVDRKGSLWEQRAKEWLDAGAQGEPPFIEVRQLIFEGTYDAFQWDRVGRRQHVFDASLFGSLLPADAWERVPDGRKKELLEAAPSFSPLKNP